MLKKLKDVLKKDKTRLSNEELEWQQKFEYLTVQWLFIAFFISSAIVILISCFVPKNRIQEFIILIIWLMIFVVIGIICSFLYNGGTEAKRQLEENRKKQKREKILFCIEQKDFSRLTLKNDEIAQALFQLALKEELIKFKSIQELKMTFIDVEEYGSWGTYNEDNLLDFFDIEE